MRASPSVLSAFARRVCATFLLIATACGGFADIVTDWNLAFETSLNPATERGPRVPIRTLAIMHAAMFDAVNGVVRKYEPLHVNDAPPPGAHPEAAAIQAAYAVMTALRPTNQSTWDAQLAASLAQLPADPALATSITDGRSWGTAVASAILAWRAGDHSSDVLPPFVGSSAAGFWRHAPNQTAATAGYANLVTVPFALEDPMAFDPGPPYGFTARADALASAAYAADLNEVKAYGGATSTLRTAAQADEALFINAVDIADLNRAMRSLVHPHATVVDNARVFALFNIAGFDVQVVFFRVKYLHDFWRPFQGVNFADEDNNAATEKDAAWTSLRPTPSHPEFLSAHVAFFAAALQGATRLVGDSGAVEISTPTFAGARTYASLEAFSDATIEARVNIGFHFRETCTVSQAVGREVGDHIVNRMLLPLRGSGMVNLSVRGRAGAADDTLIAGFVVQTGSKQVLIRGVGPALQSYGVTSALADPRVVLFDSAGGTIATNDNWSSGDPAAVAALTSATEQAGAFAFTAGSLDAALLATLAPGSYTIHVLGAGGAPGTALIEAYEVP